MYHLKLKTRDLDQSIYCLIHLKINIFKNFSKRNGRNAPKLKNKGRDVKSIETPISYDITRAPKIDRKLGYLGERDETVFGCVESESVAGCCQKTGIG